MTPNQNALLDNYKPFQDDKNTPNSTRITTQLILAIFLLLLSLASTINILNFYIFIFVLLAFIKNLLNLIVGIWMIILTIKKQSTRNNCLGIISLISSIICLVMIILEFFAGSSIFDLIQFIFLILVTSYNMKCKSCDN